jgi:hypothetical protein
MEWSERVGSFLDKLAHAQWWSKAAFPSGIRVANGIPVRQVSSWDECNVLIASPGTIGFQTALSNCLQLEIQMAQPGCKWSLKGMKIQGLWVRRLTEVLHPIVTSAVSLLRFDENLASRYFAVIEYYMILGGLFYQYEHAAKDSRIIEGIVSIFIDGHCVCGWDGDIPEGAKPVNRGTLLIY